MAAVAEKITRERLQVLQSTTKPYFELIGGEAIQKSVPTRLHSILQFVLAVMLSELGYKARPELTLDIDEAWAPVPDVCGILGPEQDPYPTSSVAVACEILSPDDRFTLVIRKCRRYAEWGVQDILVFDPLARDAWYWEPGAGDLVRFNGPHPLRSLPASLDSHEVFRRLDSELA
jgi:Uma2 family endonuclease